MGGRVVTVGKGIPSFTPGSEPDVRLLRLRSGCISTSFGSSVHEPLSQVRHWRRLLTPGAWHLRSQRWTHRPVLSPLRAHRHTSSAQDPPSFCLYAFSCTGPTSAYPRHYPGPSLLRASYSVRACDLIACSSIT